MRNNLYGVWQSMKQRCYNPKNPAYARYGGRGIALSNDWLSSFHIFASDMGPRPEGMTIERIDNDKGYCKENCRWASRKEQMLNRCNTLFVTVDGVSHRAHDLARLAGMKTDSIIERSHHNLDMASLIDKKRRVFLYGLSLGGKANGARNKAKTHCKHGHPFSPDNTRITKSGNGRICKACHTNRERTRRILARQT